MRKVNLWLIVIFAAAIIIADMYWTGIKLGFLVAVLIFIAAFSGMALYYALAGLENVEPYFCSEDQIDDGDDGKDSEDNPCKADNIMTCEACNESFIQTPGDERQIAYCIYCGQPLKQTQPFGKGESNE